MAVQELRKDQVTPRFVVVEGPIGVGKTSLATRLAQRLSAELILEDVGQNPFLEAFYKSRRSSALPAQLFFLFQRAKMIENLRQSDLFATVRVADFHIAKDNLFAELNLGKDELELYEQIRGKLDIDAPEPDLVVYLQASVDALMERITQRSESFDRFIDRGYMESVADAYARFYHDYDESPLLIVNSSFIDPVKNDGDFDALYGQVNRITGGRHFFNPVAVSFG